MNDYTVTNKDVICDFCHLYCGEHYIDGQTKRGRWANMCPTCFPLHGKGLGTGLGQEYVKGKKVKG